jgi:hypothetical protein
MRGRPPRGGRRAIIIWHERPPTGSFFQGRRPAPLKTAATRFMEFGAPPRAAPGLGGKQLEPRTSAGLGCHIWAGLATLRSERRSARPAFAGPGRNPALAAIGPPGRAKTAPGKDRTDGGRGRERTGTGGGGAAARAGPAWCRPRTCGGWLAEGRRGGRPGAESEDGTKAWGARAESEDGARAWGARAEGEDGAQGRRGRTGRKSGAGGGRRPGEEAEAKEGPAEAGGGNTGGRTRPPRLGVRRFQGKRRTSKARTRARPAPEAT